MRQVSERCGVKLTPHSFRHACATHMIENGASLVDVAELLGHANLDTTRRYVSITNRHLKDVHSATHPLG